MTYERGQVGWHRRMKLATAKIEQLTVEDFFCQHLTKRIKAGCICTACDHQFKGGSMLAYQCKHRNRENYSRGKCKKCVQFEKFRRYSPRCGCQEIEFSKGLCKACFIKDSNLLKKKAQYILDQLKDMAVALPEQSLLSFMPAIREMDDDNPNFNLLNNNHSEWQNDSSKDSYGSEQRSSKMSLQQKA